MQNFNILWGVIATVLLMLVAFVVWSRVGLLDHTNKQPVHDMTDASQWFITTSCQPRVYDSQNNLITAFVNAFEQIVDVSTVQLLNLEVAIKSLLYQKTPRFFCSWNHSR